MLLGIYMEENIKIDIARFAFMFWEVTRVLKCTQVPPKGKR